MSKIKLKVLGCGDPFGSGGMMQASFYVETPGVNYMIDCGATTIVAMNRNGISTDDVDVIILSHFHGDHFGGLPFFLLKCYYADQRKKKLTIISPEGGRERVQKLMNAMYQGTERILDELPVTFETYSSLNSIIVDQLNVKGVSVSHSEQVKPHALRIEHYGKTIAYSGDTQWTDALIEVADNADLFICENNFYDLDIDGHMSYQDLLRNDNKLNYKNILLTHLSEEALKNISKIKHPVAKDDMEITL